MFNDGQSMNNGGSLDAGYIVNGRNVTEPYWLFPHVFPRRHR